MRDGRFPVLKSILVAIALPPICFLYLAIFGLADQRAAPPEQARAGVASVWWA
jgi:hypothetical protein